MLVGFGRRKADAAIAHDDGGNAVPARRGHFGVPCCLAVIMGVNINKARGNDLAARVDFFAGVVVNDADLSYQAAIYRDIRLKRFAAAAIDHSPSANDQIMHFSSPQSQWIRS